MRILGSSSRVSGLAVSDVDSRLYQLETVPSLFAIMTYDIKSPQTACFRRLAACTGRTQGPQGVAAGLAYWEQGERTWREARLHCGRHLVGGDHVVV